MSPSRSGFSWAPLLLPAYAPAVAASSGHGAVLAVLAIRALDLGATPDVAALVVAVFGVGSLLSSLPSGTAVARLGERRALVVAGLIDAAAMVVGWRTESLVALAITALLSGATWSVYLLARQSFLIDVVPMDRRARAMSLLGGSHRLGMLIGPLLGAAVIHRFGLAAVFALAAVASLLAALASALIPDVPASRDVEPTHLSQVLRRHRHTLVTVGSAVLIISGTRQIRMLVVPLWAHHIGLSAAAASLLLGIAAAVDLALFYPSGWIMDTFGRTGVATACVAVLGAGVAGVPLTQTFAALLVVALFMAVGNGLASGIVMTLGADNAPTVGRAQFLGAWRLCSDVGNSGWPAGVSALVAVLPLGVACLATGAATLASAWWVAWWVSRSERRRRARLAAS